MQARVQKWGNSLAIRIPKPFAAQMGIETSSAVDVSVVDGCLVITPAQKPRVTLDELLAGVTPENVHAETDWGKPVGREIW
jgi:antitoxin MazE